MERQKWMRYGNELINLTGLKKIEYHRGDPEEDGFFEALAFWFGPESDDRYPYIDIEESTDVGLETLLYDIAEWLAGDGAYLDEYGLRSGYDDDVCVPACYANTEFFTLANPHAMLLVEREACYSLSNIREIAVELWNDGYVMAVFVSLIGDDDEFEPKRVWDLHLGIKLDHWPSYLTGWVVDNMRSADTRAFSIEDL